LQELQNALPEIMEHYNNMPSGGLFGHTPFEVIAGSMPNKKLYAPQIATAKKLRLAVNQKVDCENTG